MITIDTPQGDSAWYIGVAIFCLVAIFFLVLAKFSFARLREEHLDDMEGISEETKNFLRNLYKKPAYFINTAQFFILFFILLLAGMARHVLSDGVEHLQFMLGTAHGWLDPIVNLIILCVVSMVVLIIGEIIPKALGLSYPMKYMRFTTSVVVLIGVLARPFVFVATMIGECILKLFDAKYRTEVDLVHTEEEIRMMVNRSHLEGELDHVEGELIDNVFDFVERRAREVMIPRQAVDCIYVEDSFDETLAMVKETKHTRYPLCVEDKDHIIGLIHIRDLMDREAEARADIRSIRRDILTVPEVMKLSVLLQYMRTRRIYQAVVVDEYGGTVGLVGLEDVIEELVGDIQDEHESQVPSMIKREDGTFSFDGTILVDDVEDLMDITIDDAEEDTIGGYIFGLLERTPVVGDEVPVQGYMFRVTEMDGYRIARIEAIPMLPLAHESEDGDVSS